MKTKTKEKSKTTHWEIKKKSTRAKRVGIWVVVVTKQQDLIKWGEDGGTVKPFKTFKKAKEHANWLYDSESLCDDDVLYYLFVFDNGQIKTYEF